MQHDRSRQERDVVAKIGVDTAEKEKLKVRLIFKQQDLIFADPPRPIPPEAQRAPVLQSGLENEIRRDRKQVRAAGSKTVPLSAVSRRCLRRTPFFEAIPSEKLVRLTRASREVCRRNGRAPAERLRRQRDEHDPT